MPFFELLRHVDKELCETWRKNRDKRKLHQADKQLEGRPETDSERCNWNNKFPLRTHPYIVSP